MNASERANGTVVTTARITMYRHGLRYMDYTVDGWLAGWLAGWMDDRQGKVRQGQAWQQQQQRLRAREVVHAAEIRGLCSLSDGLRNRGLEVVAVEKARTPYGWL